MSRVAVIHTESAGVAAASLLKRIAAAKFAVEREDVPAAIARAARVGYEVIVALGEQDAVTSRDAGIALGVPVIVQYSTTPSEIDRLARRVSTIVSMDAHAAAHNELPVDIPSSPLLASSPLQHPAASEIPAIDAMHHSAPSVRSLTPPPSRPQSSVPAEELNGHIAKASDSHAAEGSSGAAPRRVSVVMRDGTTSVMDVPDDINVGGNPLLIKRALRARGVDCVSVALVDESQVKPRTPNPAEEDFGHVRTFKPAKRMLSDISKLQSLS